MVTSQQTIFFENMKSCAPENLNVAQLIADRLGISVNEIYKKMRGESSLSFNQALEICDVLKVPFNYQPDNAVVVPFVLPNRHGSNPDILSYLKGLLENLKGVHAKKNRHITITTDDIPIFHFFKYPELTGFKLFFWMNSLTRSVGGFQMTSITAEVVDIATELHELYLEVPSTEIWAKDTVHGTIEQVRYAFEAGYFESRELAAEVVRQLRSCLSDVNAYAVGSRKTAKSERAFQWYCCDVLGSIIYLVEANDSMSCFNRFNTFDYLRTDDQRYCRQTKDWMGNIISRSVSFSGHGEKERNRYVHIAESEIDKLLGEIGAIG